MIYLIPAFLTPTILVSLWIALRKDYDEAMALNWRMIQVMQRQQRQQDR